MGIFQIVLITAAFLCGLVAGFLFAFAVVVMPGIRRLEDGEFLQAFQAIDRVIQGGRPLFVLTWVGSALALVSAGALGLRELGEADRWMVIAAAVLYMLGVQLPTAAVNIPLNNRLQRLDPRAMDGPARRRAREAFEPRWNRWNVFRTWCATVLSGLLLLVLLRM